VASEENGQDHRSRDDELRDVAIKSAIANIVGLAVQVGILVAIAKRDSLARLLIRYRWYVLREWRHAHEQRLIAELRADLSRIEHHHHRGARDSRGLYGGLAGDGE
jgi:hypothetical protein